MARPLRIHMPGAYYHVMARGNNQQEICCDDKDYEYFLLRIDITLRCCGNRVYAWCMMRNHFHLLVRSREFPISMLMQHLNSKYAQRFNVRYARVGHVFQGRFKSLIIERSTYFTRVLRYIARNPVRAGLVARPTEWQWSSCRGTAGLDDPPALLAVDEVWDLFDPAAKHRAQQLYTEFVTQPSGDIDVAAAGPIFIGGDAMAQRVRMAVKTHVKN